MILRYLEESAKIHLNKKLFKKRKKIKPTCMKLNSKRMRVMNMKASNTRPASCIQFLGLLSPKEGTPANRLLPSTRDSANTSSRAPIKAKFLSKNCRSHRMEYAIVWKKCLLVSIFDTWFEYLPVTQQWKTKYRQQCRL